MDASRCSTYLDVSKPDTRTCLTGTNYCICMACSVREYRSGNGQNSSVAACRVSQCAYLLVWMGVSNGRLDKVCLLWTKVKNVVWARVLQKVVQALGNIIRWVCRFTIVVGSARWFRINISVSNVNMNEVKGIMIN